MVWSFTQPYRAKRALDPRFFTYTPCTRARWSAQGSTCVCTVTICSIETYSSPGWEGREGPLSLVAQTDPILHMEQRKPWNRAFSSAAMKEYEVIVAKRVRQLVGCLEELIERSDERASAVVDIARWLKYFT